MDQARPYVGHFKQYAFSWKPEFGQRQTQAYERENIRYVEQYQAPDFTTEEAIEQFVDNQCYEDINRYSYMSNLIKDFLNGADLDVLRQRNSHRQALPIMERKALLDDRNDANGARNVSTGNFRPSKGGLTASELYYELKAPVIDAFPS